MLLFVLFLSIMLLAGNNLFDFSKTNSNEMPKTTVSSENIEAVENILVVYKMVFEGLWSEERFPKSYPKFRPPAQWSMIFGQIHDDSHHIFHIASNASSAMQSFAERGDPTGISTSQDNEGVYDQFTTLPLLNGSGIIEQEFLVDANHSFVSIVSRIIPSPDWFVGVDSLSLIKDGTWIDNITVELHPLDAGTDGGLTFTSPKWRLQSQLPIQIHTSKEPKHGAASFYYPDKEILPNIAQVTITKVMEVSLGAELKATTLELTTETDSEYSTTPFVDEMTTHSSDISSVPAESYQLSESMSSIVANVSSSFSNNEAYFPKLFRPKITFVNIKDKKKSHRQNTQSNLQTSFLSSRRNKTKTAPSLFNW